MISVDVQTLNHTLKKLMEIEGAIKAQISRVHQQSKELLRISNHRVQKTKVAAKQPDMSVIELAKKFNDLQKRVQSHEQVTTQWLWQCSLAPVIVLLTN